MHARVNHFQDDPANLDEVERFAEQNIVPQLQTVPGFLGVLSLLDRSTGRSLGITFWESEEAMRSSEATADRLRGEINEAAGPEVGTVERYEVARRLGV